VPVGSHEVRSVLLAAALAASLASGCALRQSVVSSGLEDRLETVKVGGQVFRIHFWHDDELAAGQVARAVAAAAGRIARWGAITQEVTITIHPSHAALEAAVHREGYQWLRAWARFQTIDLQSPRTWGWFGATDKEVEELLTHELTHCAMYQAAATEWTWPHKGIPLWFREGLASVTAEQGYRRSTNEELWRYYTRSVPGAGDGFPSGVARAARGVTSTDGDPVTDPEPLYQERSDVVYGAAHRSFEFLLSRYGEKAVRGALQLMHDGRTFDVAFAEAFGLSEKAFASEYRRFVLWQGWR
jgi:hypothetical protein